MDQSVPCTVESLATDLRELGVAAGDVLMLHSSMSGLGFVAGGVHAVVQALLEVLGPAGTLVVPTHTPENCDPAGWRNPPVPPDWWPVIRDKTPGFDPARTPTRWMGVIAETVRTWPGAIRSDHPQVSCAAVGAHATAVVGVHQLDDAHGERSPLGALYRLDGKVLLLGCGYSSNTSLHLAEWRQDAPSRGEISASMRQPDGTSRWVTWIDVLPDEDDFDELGADFDASGAVTRASVGNAQARLMSQRALVDFAVSWMATHRPQGSPLHSKS
jgi:aminoglycoside 3-N-acetyltransferase